MSMVISNWWLDGAMALIGFTIIAWYAWRAYADRHGL